MKFRSHHQSQAGRIDLWVAALAIVMIVIVLVLARPDIQSTSKTFLAPMGSPMKFVGVRPDCGDDLFDPYGNRMGKLLYDNTQGNSWATNIISREFIFELTETNQGKISAQLKYRHKSPYYNLSGSTSVKIQKLPNGHRRLIAQVQLPRTWYQRRIFFRPRRRPLEKMELDLKYYAEHAPEKTADYPGPFKEGQSLPATNGISGTIQRVKKGLTVMTELNIQSQPSDILPGASQIMVYDKSGRQQRPQSTSSNTSRGTSQVTLKFNTLMPEEISRIVIPKAQVASFKNFLVQYKDLPYRSTPVYWDGLIEAMGGTNVVRRLKSNPFHSLDQALSMIHLARGDLIYRIWRMYESPPGGRQNRIDLRKASPELREKVRQSIRSWLVSYNKNVRMAAVGLGLSGGWAEFVDPALELMELDEDFFQVQVARLLSENLDLFSKAQYQRLVSLMGNANAVINLRPIISKLTEIDHPEVQDALWQMALDDRPWIWYPVMQDMQLEDAPLDPPDRIHFQQRLFLAREIRNDLTNEDIDRIYAGLPDLLTYSLWKKDVTTFMGLYRRLAKRSNPSPAIRVLRTLFQNDSNPSRRSGLYVEMIRQLNQWQGANFGELGSKVGGRNNIRLKNEEWLEMFKEILQTGSDNQETKDEEK